MMNRFTLTSTELPHEWNGYELNTDFHQIINIIKMMNDVELSAEEKPFILRKMLFVDKMPPVNAAFNAFEWFESCGADKPQGEPHGVKDFDFEQDAREIYASFRQVYGIDLMQPMHWWLFSALLDGVTACPCALANKIHMRHIDDSKQDKAAAIERAKRAAAIEDSVSKSVASMNEELARRLKAGLPFDDLIDRM